jgi:hypothetical protein
MAGPVRMRPTDRGILIGELEGAVKELDEVLNLLETSNG